MNELKDENTDFQNNAIRFVNLTRKFGNFIAVNNINLEVPKGSFYGFLGQNGAGKSTTINMLIGLLRPTTGQIYVDGHNIEKRPVEIKRKLGIVPEDLNLYERLKGREFLIFSGSMYGLSRREATDRTDEILNLLEVDGDKLINDLSTGMKKKVSLGAAIIHQPSILILDEPFISVDAISARKIKDILEIMVSQGVTIFITSHILEIIEKLCSHVAIIHNGVILLDGKKEQFLTQSSDGLRYSLEEVFVNAIGAETSRGELSWLK